MTPCEPPPVSTQTRLRGLPCGPGAGGASSRWGEETATPQQRIHLLLESTGALPPSSTGPGPRPASARCDPGEQTQKHPKLGRKHELPCYFIGFVANKAKPQGGAEFLVYLV